MSIDPTRTITLRKAFATSMSKRFLLLRRNIVDLVRDQDAFGLVTNAGYNPSQPRDSHGRWIDSGGYYKELPSKSGKRRVFEGPFHSPRDAWMHSYAMDELDTRRSNSDTGIAYSKSGHYFSMMRGDYLQEDMDYHESEGTHIYSIVPPRRVKFPDFWPEQPTDNARTTNQKFASTQVNIEDAGPLVRRLQQSLDPKDVVELEDKPHVTIRYGLHDEDPDVVKRLIGRSGIIWLRLGRLSLFRNDKQDVLKVAVQSNRLDELHRQLGLLPNTNKFPEYQPHLTIAYLKPGTGDKYLNLISGLEGKLVIADHIAFSDKERNHTTVVMNTRWQYQTNMQKLEAFRIWLQDQMHSTIKGANEWWEYYVQQGYEKGAKRAVQDVMKGMTGLEKTKKGFNITERQFMESSFGRVVPIEKVKLLASRVFSDLDGITDYMETNIIRALTDGLTQGRHPKDIATEMTKTVNIGLNRAKIIAQNEIIRSHAEGVLDNLERMGVEEVGVMVEWSTSGDNRVCPLCKPLQGVVLTVDEARGLFPRHPRCRCSPVPATIIQRKGQVRTKGSIDAAIDRSLGLERKSTKRGIFSRGSSAWAGAKVKIRRNRPALKR